MYSQQRINSGEISTPKNLNVSFSQPKSKYILVLVDFGISTSGCAQCAAKAKQTHWNSFILKPTHVFHKHYSITPLSLCTMQFHNLQPDRVCLCSNNLSRNLWRLSLLFRVIPSSKAMYSFPCPLSHVHHFKSRQRYHFLKFWLLRYVC